MKRNYKIISPHPISILVLTLALLIPAASHAAASSPKKLKLGTSFSVATQNAAYSSSDEEIAYVNAGGLVTGKQQGEATIRIKRGGNITRRKVTVVANGQKKKGVKVCTGEIALVKNAVFKK